MPPARRATRVPTIVFDGEALGERPVRAVAAGRARRIGHGVYTIDLARPLDELVRTHVWEILGRIIPDTLIADRSAGPITFVPPGPATAVPGSRATPATGSAVDTLFVVSQRAEVGTRHG